MSDAKQNRRLCQMTDPERVAGWSWVVGGVKGGSEPALTDATLCTNGRFLAESVFFQRASNLNLGRRGLLLSQRQASLHSDGRLLGESETK